MPPNRSLMFDRVIREVGFKHEADLDPTPMPPKPTIRRASEAETQALIATFPDIGPALERGAQEWRDLAASSDPALRGWSDDELRQEIRARDAAADLAAQGIAVTASDLPPDADPIGLDDSTDLQLLDELLRRTCARLQLDPDSRPARHLLDRLMGAKTFVLTLADAEADHADR